MKAERLIFVKGIYMKNSKEELYSEVFTEYYPKILKYAYNRLPDEETAKDIAQDVFVVLWEKFDTLKIQDREEYKYWLYKVASNRILKYYKKRKETVSMNDGLEVLLGDSSTDTVFDEVTGENKDFDEFSAVEKALASLTEAERELYLMYHVKEMSYSELASYYGTSTAVIGMKIHRLKKKIFKISKKFIKDVL